MNDLLPQRDGDGYLRDIRQWTPQIGLAMAQADDFPIDQQMWDQVMFVRSYYQKTDKVPSIRQFIKAIKADKKELFRMWKNGPLKPITKYGGMPKPTGCV